MVLVQNKVDLIDQAVVSSGEAEAMARRLGLKFYRACVKEDLNVTEGELSCNCRSTAAPHQAAGGTWQLLEAAQDGPGMSMEAVHCAAARIAATSRSWCVCLSHMPSKPSLC
eukprot:GHRQ01038687.1.p1 GENE.GHRQ01038687.1~~GHRQ01038687.1.p1  ORF type:complete len:112 (+),score=25.52 GHRQ01038687.1:345-680(+)